MPLGSTRENGSDERAKEKRKGTAHIYAGLQVTKRLTGETKRRKNWQADIQSCIHPHLKEVFIIKKRHLSHSPNLREKLADDISRDIREPEVPASVGIGESLVIQAHQMKDRGVEIVHVNATGNR